MPWLLDVLYLFTLFVLSPWLVWRAIRTGRYRRGLRAKLFGLRQALPPGAVWFHGVSVGEIHLLRQVVAAFQKRYPGLPCVLSTTTDTGLDEARKCFPDLFVFPFPFDFSWAVRRTLRRICPRLIVLAEAELWPNFLLAARRQGTPVAVINGRMSPRSLKRYRRLGPLSRWLFGHVDLLLVQTEHYARAVRILGAHPDCVHVTGSVKFDGVLTDRHNPRTHFLREMLEVKDGELIWIAGSTQAPEEEIVLRIWRSLRTYHPNLRLFLVPRQKDRFEEVAQLLERSGVEFARWSSCAAPPSPYPLPPSGGEGRVRGRPVVLVDTIGELAALWGLADVAFVGGSLDGRRGGQNMIEPAAFGAAVVFGPHVWNFANTAARLIEAHAACQVADAGQLETLLRLLLDDPAECRRLGAAARDFVLRQQGATEQTVALLGQLLTARRPLAA